MSRRLGWLLVALATVVGLHLFVGQAAGTSEAGATQRAPAREFPTGAGEAGAGPARRIPVAQAGAAPAGDPEQDRLRWPVRAGNEDEAVVDLFAPPPPPLPPRPAALPAPVAPVVTVTAPAAPVTPRFPHAVLGAWADERGRAVFLATPGGTTMVHAMDVVDGAFRIESIVPGKMVVRYLPMNESQELTWSEQH